MSFPAHSRLPRCAPPPTPRRRRGLSLIELLMFIGIVSIALAAVLRVFNQAGAASADPLALRQALAIAESLLAEVQAMPFTFCDSEDANIESATSTAGCAGTPEAPGPEASETRTSLPSFDHVNDYHGLVMDGIRDLTGTAVSGLENYAARIRVGAAALNTLTAASDDVLEITVSVSGPGGVAITLSGYRSRHAPNQSL